ncbi:maleylpyruvate isomerase family mycothiol-dependent enzyme [Streptomyces naphthomycinicus]|uniref:maleylpyruvate isomerase family mycothiol-dependent enzyme n=1 Tax=Streptomyces naphthomycinicus TaxID=2872625 RepID=UPI001CED685E|nr:maleylpyruvate isomerase family mycothiol-dependent enzyme [Streptomyces sp. TML10]
MTAIHGTARSTEARWTKERWLHAFRQEAARFLAAIDTARLDAAVPSCPGWTVSDLVAHLAGVYRWHRQHLRRRTASTPRHERPEVPEGIHVLTWWQREFTAMAEELDAVSPAAPAWNWAGRPPVARFWHRRMAHETALHRWDAENALGVPTAIGPAPATDGVAEVLDTFLPGGRNAGRPGPAGTVALSASDTAARWRVTVRETGVSLSPPPDSPGAGPVPDCVAEGTAEDLLLVLWGRATAADRLRVEGDATLLDALRAR